MATQCTMLAHLRQLMCMYMSGSAEVEVGEEPAASWTEDAQPVCALREEEEEMRGQGDKRGGGGGKENEGVRGK